MADQLDEKEIQECFHLFDQEGTKSIQIKEIGTVMRSLGLAPSEAVLRDIVTEAKKKDSSKVLFTDFLEYVKRVKALESEKSVDAVKELEGMKLGMLHFFDKVSKKKLREDPPTTVKLADLKHLLSSVGEKMSEEEMDEMMKEVRTNCQVQDGRVSFDDFVKLLVATQ
eukprot:gnl/MRDRNA2_/MRDRNA2_137366_c0_seq1.p1 gnl/MRDRNA2_/MRDRNA2_137366_c0~~gnl/MRDRNA2_/MRDRNA2_137366_c0_seq1.p1  ORF type:complete len:194 (+),score=46.24 gnl/MRDRNA2_/MRDRNA2_137366_c0_seq1:80-583(+)